MEFPRESIRSNKFFLLPYEGNSKTSNDSRNEFYFEYQMTKTEHTKRYYLLTLELLKWPFEYFCSDILQTRNSVFLKTWMILRRIHKWKLVSIVLKRFSVSFTLTFLVEILYFGRRWFSCFRRPIRPSANRCQKFVTTWHIFYMNAQTLIRHLKRRF